MSDFAYPADCCGISLVFRYWLYYMIGVLMKQKLRFQIIVVEQEEEGIFNKGQLMNTGFKWAMANVEHVWDCVVFHDVDMISEVYGTVYECRSMYDKSQHSYSAIIPG